MDGGSVSGNLDGGPQATAVGTLSYDPQTGPIQVTLQTISSGTASFIGNEFKHIGFLDGEDETGNVNLTNVTLVGPGLNHNYTWTITGPNAGNVTGSSGTFTFRNVGNLTSGSNATSNDTFVFQHNTVDDNIAGTLTGGTGNDTANYSAFTGDQSGANSIALGVNVVNFDTIIGGTGNNTIIGANTANNWLISGANSGTVNGTTFSNFANVVGNNVSDDFAFSPSGTLASVTGSGLQTETLDFSLHSAAVHVVLTNMNNGNGTVGPISNGFTGIHGLIGTGNESVAGNDSLTGDGIMDFNFWVVGVNTFDSGNLANDSGFIFNVDVFGSDAVGPQFNYFGIANLNSGPGMGLDDFIFGPGIQQLGKIDGTGAAQSIIDFSAGQPTLTVNLQTNSATPIDGGAPGGFIDMNQFVGDYGDSTLIGQNVVGQTVDTTWTIIGNGNGTIVNTGSCDTVRFNEFSNLQGGIGNDAFVMSADGNNSQGLVQGHVWGGSANISVEPNDGTGASGFDSLSYDSNYYNFNGGTFPQTVNLAAGTATGINGGNPGGIASIDSVSFFGGNNSLSGNVFIVNAHNAGTVDNVAFSNVQNLVGAPGPDSFTFTNDGSLDGTITGNACDPACNSLSYAGYNAAVTNTVDLQFDSASHINANGPGGFSNIGIFTGSANSALVGMDEDSTWTFSSATDGTVSGSTPTSYSDSFHSFATLQGGSGNDTFTEHNGTQFPGAIDGGGGTNTLSFASFTPGNDVTVNLGTGSFKAVNNVQSITGGTGVGGNDTITGDARHGDGNDGHYLWHLVNPAGGNYSFVTDNAQDDTVNFRGFENLTGSSDNDTFFFGANSSVIGTLNGGGGSNTLQFAADDFGQNISLNLATSTIVTGGLSPVSVVGTLVGSSFDDVVDTLTGAAGDTLIGGNGNNSWAISGPDAGVVSEGPLVNFAFSGISNLVGGALGDTFSFSPLSLITGTVDGAGEGGGAVNTLDFSGFNAPVAVDLANFSATPIFSGANNGFANISNMVGSGTGIGGDTLYGAAGDQVWNLANDSTDTGNTSGGGFTFSGVANLHGNTGNDTFVFGNNSIVSGTIDGGADFACGVGHNNVLDFSQDSQNVSVSFADHRPRPFAEERLMASQQSRS